MSRTSVPGLNWEKVPNRAVGYRRYLGRYFQDDHDSLNGVLGDGGIYTTAPDLDRWLTALHSGKLAQPSSLRRAFLPERKSNSNYDYGYGWVITRLSGAQIIWHNGSWVGFDSFVGRLVQQKANIIVLSNAGLGERNVDVTKDLGFQLANWLIMHPGR